MQKSLLFFFFCCLLSTVLKAQQPVFTHYSMEDGLSENTVMSILQDRKGMMWFSTWDGLDKFDGYTFTTYKASFNNSITLTTNRIDKIKEDRWGFLWLITNDRQAFRFDPATETFEHVSSGKGIGSVTIADITLLPNGTVWLQTVNEGAIRVSTDPQTFKLSKKWYLHQRGTEIHGFFQDKSGGEWILSNRGLDRISKSDVLTSGFAQKASHLLFPNTCFYSANETSSDIFFGSDDGKVWRYRKAFRQFIRFQLPLHSPVIAIHDIGQGRLAFITRNDGFCLYNPSTGQMEIVDGKRLPAAPVHDVYVDRFNGIWLNQNIVGTVVYYNTSKKKLHIEKVTVTEGAEKSYPNFHIHEDVLGHVWIHPRGGGFSYYDPVTDEIHPFRYDEKNDPEHFFSDKIHTAYSDRQGNLWLATRSKGLEKVTFKKQPFTLTAPNPGREEEPGNDVRALGEDNDGHIFVGAKDGRLRVYDLNYNYIGYLTSGGRVADSGTPMGGNVYFMMKDRRQVLWIATKGNGIFKAEPRGNLTYRLTHYVHNPADKYSLSDNNVYCIYEDYKGRIWVATYGGGLNYVETGSDGRERFVNPFNRLKTYPLQLCPKVRFVTGDNRHNIWIGTTRGVLRLNGDFDSPEHIRFSHYSCESGNPASLSNNDVHWILSTRRHELYFATYGGGLSKLERLSPDGKAFFSSYTTADGAPSDIMLSVCEDNKGFLWLSTETGISQFNLTDKRFDNYTKGYMNMRIRFNEATVLYTTSGQVLFGTDKGFLAFDPTRVHKSSFVPSIVLSKLLIANVETTPGDSSVLKKTLDYTSELDLPHNKNTFTIQFAALDYTNPSEIHYAYRLKGFDEKWNYVGNQRTATYTNLPNGNYVFEVRSTNADGVWCNNIRSLVVKRLPSFWETGWAYTLYIICLLLVVGTAFYIFFIIYSLKHRVQMEKQMTEMKLRFFTDISHELRTPLVLISGPVEYILKKKPLSDDLRKQLQVVERNTNRMLRLINQLLDFRKIQNKKMQMRVQRFDMVLWTKDIMESFYSSAEEHHIRLLFDAPSSSVYVWADKDKYEKIVINLLSNAFKYTPDGKEIKVSVGENVSSVFVSVTDQGIGIDKSRQSSIFKRFENIADKDIFNNSSTGIGLSVAKKLADMHKAVIDVESSLGQGSSFRVSFKKGKAHFDKSVEFLMDDHVSGHVDGSEPVSHIISDTDVPVSSSESTTQETERKKQGLMLIVEDNSELRTFLRSIFSSEFNLLESANGEEGLQKALTNIPDIIISDIMMPVKDGIEMIKELRSNLSVSHIPVILLTAKASVENRIEGLEYGADDYITKPFSVAYLSARVKNLLVRREQLQKQFRERLVNKAVPDNVTETETSTGKTVVEMTDGDRKFIDTFVELVQRNLGNGNLEIEAFARELAVSRSVFFKKVKTLLGVAPIEFVREMRIRKAIELIRSGQHSMSQVAYMVGFNDPHYFSKTFKQKTGMTPSEYQRKNSISL